MSAERTSPSVLFFGIACSVPIPIHTPDRLAVELAVHFNTRTDMRADLLDLYKLDLLSSARQLLLKKRGIKALNSAAEL